MTAAFRLFTGFLLSTAACAGARAETVVLAADEWCSINCEPDSDRPGYMIEIARLALARDGHRLDYIVMPWSRALEEAKPSSARYVELIDETVNELRARGELKAVLDRYNLTDWAP